MTIEQLGKIVREAWITWASKQEDVKDHPNWLIPWRDLTKRDKEVDMLIAIRLLTKTPEILIVVEALRHVEFWVRMEWEFYYMLSTNDKAYAGWERGVEDYRVIYGKHLDEARVEYYKKVWVSTWEFLNPGKEKIVKFL